MDMVFNLEPLGSLQVKGLTDSLDQRISALEKLKENEISEHMGTTD